MNHSLIQGSMREELNQALYFYNNLFPWKLTYSWPDSLLRDSINPSRRVEPHDLLNFHQAPPFKGPTSSNCHKAGLSSHIWTSGRHTNPKQNSILMRKHRKLKLVWKWVSAVNKSLLGLLLSSKTLKTIYRAIIQSPDQVLFSNLLIKWRFTNILDKIPMR